MARILSGDTLVLASHNPGKLKEIAALIEPFGLGVVSAGALGLPAPDETEDSYIGNAALKALAAARGAGLPALADDSGLSVTALDGAPGIFSARWAGPSKDFGFAMRKVEEALVARGASDRSAIFVCALALAWPDGHVEAFEGRWHGRLVFPPRGDNGFGYDPIFLPDGESQTCGEMDPERKHAMSHRARAFAQLVDACLVARRSA